MSKVSSLAATAGILLTAVFVGVTFYKLGYHDGRVDGVYSGWSDGTAHGSIVSSFGLICDKHPDWCHGYLEDEINRHSPRSEDFQ